MSDLAIIPATALVPADVFKPGGVDALLESIAQKARAVKPDVSTRQGRGEIASLALKVAKSKTLLDDMGKELVSEWKAQSGRVDAERRKVRDFLDNLKDEVRAPLTKYERDEADRIRAHELALDDITDRPDGIETAAEWKARLDLLRNWPPRAWQEFEQKAADALATEIAKAERFHADAVKREAEAAELARLRAEAEERARQEAARLQAEREAKIAEEAAAKAKQAAEEAAERAKVEAARKADAERAAAEERARKAEEARIAAEQRAEREKAEAVAAEQRRVAAAKAAEEAEAARRAANVAHKTKVNRDVLAALVGCGASEDVGKAIITALVRGAVPHVSIAY